MSELKKKRTSKKIIEKAVTSKAAAKDQVWRQPAFVIVAVFIALILTIIGAGYYMSEDAKYLRLIILRVDDTSIRMDYFIKIARLAGSTDPLSVLQRLTHEQIIKLEAPKLGIKATPEDVDRELRRIAGGESGNITESEFKEWYRQQLNESKLSNAEYRENTRTMILAARLQAYLAARVPTIAEQVHLNAIVLETYKEAQQVRERWLKGEKFADLAREWSLDGESAEQGGDIGWMPRGLMPYGFDDITFNLATNNVSDPLPYQSDPYSTKESSYYLIMVTEKAATRQLDDSALQALRNKALDNWLSQEIQYHKISHSYNSIVDAWIKYYLAKESGKNTSTSSTGSGR